MTYGYKSNKILVQNQSTMSWGSGLGELYKLIWWTLAIALVNFRVEVLFYVHFCCFDDDTFDNIRAMRCPLHKLFP